MVSKIYCPKCKEGWDMGKTYCPRCGVEVVQEKINVIKETLKKYDSFESFKDFADKTGMRYWPVYNTISFGHPDLLKELREKIKKGTKPGKKWKVKREDEQEACF